MTYLIWNLINIRKLPNICMSNASIKIVIITSLDELYDLSHIFLNLYCISFASYRSFIYLNIIAITHNGLNPCNWSDKHDNVHRSVPIKGTLISSTMTHIKKLLGDNLFSVTNNTCVRCYLYFCKWCHLQHFSHKNR